jgi:hypothetical protein
MEGKYFENGDSTVLVLKRLENEKECLIICLNYSSNHKVYDVRTLTEEEFNNWYLSNELKDYWFDDCSFRGLR